MSRLYNNFEFIGNINIPQDESKLHQTTELDDGLELHRFSFAVKETNTNSSFVEFFAMYNSKKQNTVFTLSRGAGSDSISKLEVPWEDRMKEESLDMVADFKKTIINFTTDFELKNEVGKLQSEIFNLERNETLTDDQKKKINELQAKIREIAPERKEFLHEYDAIQYLNENLTKYKNHKFRITGDVELSESKGKFYRKFKARTIEVVPDDEVSKLRATMDIFFTKDAIDDKDFKKEKKVYIDGYIQSYDRKAKKDQFYPQQFIIDANKLDLENEKHVKLLDYLKNQFDAKKKGVYHLQWIVSIFRGADKVEFTYEDLTQKQKEEVELGLSKVENFAPRGGMLGDNVEENRLVKPVLKELNKQNDFREGAVESEYDEEDLEFVPTENSSSSRNTSVNDKEEGSKSDEELDALFG